jgi:BolA protein
LSEERIAMIEQRLRDALAPTELLVKDQSHLHAGHAGAREGLGHFDVHIVSKAFNGKNRLQRHQLVYQAMGELMQTDIHALSIRAAGTDD